jgi:predicted AlkP superfamily pyrophosphatase or phosphodiesterase
MALQRGFMRKIRTLWFRSIATAFISIHTRLLEAVFCLTTLLPVAGWCASQGNAEYVVIMVWDGMRPDFVTPQHTPTLSLLAQEGTFFKNHHAIYVSSTEVNGTALSTGASPEHSGIFANEEYQPDIRRNKPVGTQDLDAVRRGDLLTHGHYIAVPTLAEIIQRGGFRTAVAGTKSVALLLDRSSERTSDAARESVNFYRGSVLPPAAMAVLVGANGGQSFPTNVTFPNVAQDGWTTRALTQGLWSNGVPKFSVLWLSDPDYSQHQHGPGSAVALEALESADRNLAKVLITLEAKNVRDKTDIFIVSDHGFSTIERGVHVVTALKEAGFRAGKEFENPQRGDIMVVGLGGSVSLYVSGHDKETIHKLVKFFQSSDFAGVIFSRVPVAGSFPLKEVCLAAANAPDLMVSLRWSAQTNQFGTPGLFVADNGKVGRGSHSSLSRFDMHNTLVAAGPDFRAGFLDEWPTGNTDLAPTILWILGLKPPESMDGRILKEALAGQKPPKVRPKQKTITASHDGKQSRWSQYLKVETVGSAIYFDEGNGGRVLQSAGAQNN